MAKSRIPDPGPPPRSGTAEGQAPVRLKDYSRTLPASLLRARESVMALIRPMLRRHDLTEQQWRVLRTLAEMDEVDITRLSRLVFLSPPSLSRILQGLVERGLVSRRIHEADLRRSLVSIAPKGRDIIREVGPEAARNHQEIERLYGAERIEQLHHMLAALEQALTGLGDCEEDTPPD